MSGSNYWILDGKTPVLCKNVHEWGKWFETAERIVKVDKFGTVMVSTVFLGINHRYDVGEPLLFETMIFGGPQDSYCERCSTWEEAEKQHLRVCGIVQRESRDGE